MGLEMHMLNLRLLVPTRLERYLIPAVSVHACVRVTLSVCPRRFVSMNLKSTVPSDLLSNSIRVDAVPKRSLNRSQGVPVNHRTNSLEYLG